MDYKVVHSTKIDGNMSLKYDYDKKALINKEIFLTKKGIDLKKSL